MDLKRLIVLHKGLHFNQEDFTKAKGEGSGKVPYRSFSMITPHHLQTKAVQERSLASVNKRACATGALQTDASQAVTSLSIFRPSSISIQPMDEEEASMDVSFRPYEPAGQCNAQYCGNKAQRDQSVQLDSRTPSSLLIAKRTKWKRKERPQEPNPVTSTDS